jgi:hypothetical protein
MRPTTKEEGVPAEYSPFSVMFADVVLVASSIYGDTGIATPQIGLSGATSAPRLSTDSTRCKGMN